MNVEELKKYDFIVAIDRSLSMTNPGSHGKTRWIEAKEFAEGIARKCMEFDDDGITVVFFNRTVEIHQNVKDGAGEIHKLFTETQPNGGTDTAKMLKEVILDGYVANRKKLETKPIIVIVVTDGEPDSQDEVVKVIVKAANAIENDDEIGITFLQVGNDPAATEFLQMLDDDLVNKYKAKFDIVDTKTCDFIEQSGLSLEEVLMQSLTD